LISSEACLIDSSSVQVREGFNIIVEVSMNLIEMHSEI
jgi:hypothetical protein